MPQYEAEVRLRVRGTDEYLEPSTLELDYEKVVEADSEAQAMQRVAGGVAVKVAERLAE